MPRSALLRGEASLHHEAPAGPNEGIKLGAEPGSGPSIDGAFESGFFFLRSNGDRPGSSIVDVIEGLPP